MALPNPQQSGETYGGGGGGNWFDQQQPPRSLAQIAAPPPGYTPAELAAIQQQNAIWEQRHPSGGATDQRMTPAQRQEYEAQLRQAGLDPATGHMLPGRNPADVTTAANQGGYTPPGGANLPGGDQRAAVEAFIANWQRTHSPQEGIAGLTQALAQQFPGTVTPYLYGNTPSNNEINLGGEKYKVLGGEGGPAAYWYIPGTDDSGGPSSDGGGFGRLGGGTGSLAGIAAEALTTSPGYQFRLGEGVKALERSAAAKGTLLTGGTLKGLTRFAQDYASGEYGNQYNRLFGEQKERYNQLYGLSNIGLSAAGQQAGLNTSYAGQAGNLAAAQAGAGSDLITQGANAGAAGTVGKANATNSAIQAAVNSGNTALVLWLMNQQQNATTPPVATPPPSTTTPSTNYSQYRYPAGNWMDPWVRS